MSLETYKVFLETLYSASFIDIFIPLTNFLAFFPLFPLLSKNSYHSPASTANMEL